MHSMTTDTRVSGNMAARAGGEPITLNLVVGPLAVFSGIWISTTEAKPALP